MYFLLGILTVILGTLTGLAISSLFAMYYAIKIKFTKE